MFGVVVVLAAIGCSSGSEDTTPSDNDQPIDQAGSQPSSGDCEGGSLSTHRLDVLSDGTYLDWLVTMSNYGGLGSYDGSATGRLVASDATIDAVSTFWNGGDTSFANHVSYSELGLASGQTLTFRGEASKPDEPNDLVETCTVTITLQ